MNVAIVTDYYNKKKFKEAAQLLAQEIERMEAKQEGYANHELCSLYFFCGNASTELYKQYAINAPAYAQRAQVCYERAIELFAPRILPEALFALAVLNHVQYEMTTELEFLQRAAAYVMAFFQHHTLCEGYEADGLCTISRYMEDYMIIVKDAVYSEGLLSDAERTFHLQSVEILLAGNPSPFFYDELRRIRRKLRGH